MTGATIAGGAVNSIFDGADAATIGGGQGNRVGPYEQWSVIAGGTSNAVAGAFTSEDHGGGFNAVVGGQKNHIAVGGFAQYSFIGAGNENLIDISHATIVGGSFNVIGLSSPWSFIGAGDSNLIALSPYSSICGGQHNTIQMPSTVTGSLSWNTIGGGSSNVIGTADEVGEPDGANGCVIGGGQNNVLTGLFSVIGGGQGNNVGGNTGSFIGGGVNADMDGDFGVICGGFSNNVEVLQSFAFVGGGQDNTIGIVNADSVILPGANSAIVGGIDNQIVTGNQCFLGGGNTNSITSAGGAGAISNATIAGGVNNNITNSLTAEGLPGDVDDAFIGGGSGNKIEVLGKSGVIGGGTSNTVSAQFASVLGGHLNTASNDSSSVLGGTNNRAMGSASSVLGGDGNAVSGVDSIVGGINSSASEPLTFAFGRSAQANFEGCVVWSDASGGATEGVACGQANQFVAKASGGVVFFSDAAATMGVAMGAGSGVGFVPISDRNRKNGFAAVNTRDVLERLMAIPVTTWRYNTEVSGATHMGPMAQDVYEQFHLGDDDKHITTIDSDGVQIAAIQGLYSLAQERETEIERVRTENEKLRHQMDALEARLARLEAAVAAK